MPELLHVHALYRSPLVAIEDVRCRAGRGDCSGEECSTGHDIVFPRSGLFVRYQGGERVSADPNHVLFFNRGESYRVFHPIAGGDDCTVFAFAPDVLRDALAAYDPAVRDRPDGLFSVSHAPSEPGSFVRQQWLRRRLHGASTRPANRGARCAGLTRPTEGGRYEVGVPELAVDEVSLRLLETVVRETFRARNGRIEPCKPVTARAHLDLAHTAKTYMADRFRERFSLPEMARAVHCSPYHLARLFKRVVGLSLHRYVNRLRLRAALERLADGAPDLTDLALELAYSSHSHFSDAFRREFKTTPTAFRRGLSTARLREMSKNLEV